jgi:hypothetical protein
MLSVIVLDNCTVVADRARTSFWLPLFRFQGASQRRHTSRWRRRCRTAMAGGGKSAIRRALRANALRSGFPGYPAGSKVSTSCREPALPWA